MTAISLPSGPEPALRPRELTGEAFQRFGTVIAVDGRDGVAVNEGRGLRFDGVADLAHSTAAAMPSLAVYRIAPSRLPLAATVFERHPRTSQVFFPIEAGRFLVVVAPEDATGEPDRARAEAFVASGVGIHYQAGIWHLPMTVLDREASFAMLMWEDGFGDTVEHRLARPLLIQD